MDINVYWWYKHFSAETGLSSRAPIQVSGWEGGAGCLAHRPPLITPEAWDPRITPRPKSGLASREMDCTFVEVEDAWLRPSSRSFIKAVLTVNSDFGALAGTLVLACSLRGSQRQTP